MLVYTDSSVYGGVFDVEFKEASGRFFDLVRSGGVTLLVSDIVRREIADSPVKVRDLFNGLMPFMAHVAFDRAVLELRDAYLSAKILGPKWADDAGHVAAATVGRADMIVSWNFRHIVHYDKIRLYNGVNLLNGYRTMEIRTPAEVIEYEDEESI